MVTTSIGIEGIAARDGEHLLVGDTPDEFAARCRTLMSDAVLAERLADAAHALVTASYSVEAMARAVAACPSPPAPPRGG